MITLLYISFKIYNKPKITKSCIPYGIIRDIRGQIIYLPSWIQENAHFFVPFNGSQLAKIKKYIPNMSLP